MKNFVITWLLTAVALVLTAMIVPGITLTGWGTAAIAALIFGLINAVVRPILFLFTLPLTILTLGVFAFVLNAFCLLLVSYFSPAGFMISGFVPALIGSIVLSIITGLLARIVPDAA